MYPLRRSTHESSIESTLESDLIHEHGIRAADCKYKGMVNDLTYPFHASPGLVTRDPDCRAHIPADGYFEHDSVYHNDTSVCSGTERLMELTEGVDVLKSDG